MRFSRISSSSSSSSSIHLSSSISSPFTFFLFCFLIVFLIISVFAFDLCHADTFHDPRAACSPANKTSCCFQNLNGCPGCSDSTVESCVCKADSRCCSDTWDSLCVERAVTTCKYNCTTQCTNPCNEVSTCPGCINKKDRECVCAKNRLPECCTMAWSARCVAVLIDACGGSAPSPSSSPSYVPPSSTPSVSASPSPSPSYVPPSATPSLSVTPSVSVSATPSPSVGGSITATPSVSMAATPSVSTSATPSASPAPGSPSSMAWGVTVFLVVLGCLSITTCGAVALYYHRKKKRVEELGIPAAANNQAYKHLDNDEEGLFDGAEDDEEELPDPFSEEFVEREMEMRKLALPPSPRPPAATAVATTTNAPAPAAAAEHLGNGNGNGNGHYVIGDTDDEDDHEQQYHQQQHEEVESELVVRDDPFEEVEEIVDPYAEL